MEDGLKNNQRDLIIAAIAKRPNITRAELFGSRAKGTFTPSSDVDIALFGENVSLDDEAAIAGELEETTLPYKVDLIRYNTITSAALKEHIKKHGRVIFESEGKGGYGASEGVTGGSEEWRTGPLGDCIILKSGGTPSKFRSDFWIGNVPWVSAKDMKSYWIEDTQDHLSEVGAQHATRLVEPKTTLMLVRGMTLHNDVPICRVRKASAFNQDVKAVLPRPGIHLEIVPYLLLANKDRLLSIVDSAGHGTGRLNTDTLLQLPVSIPPFGEQQAIARVLGTLDDKIELNRRMNQTLEAMARAIFKSWFVDFDPVRAKAQGRETGLPPHIADLFPDSFEDSELGEIPKGWEVGRLGDIIDIYDSQRIPLSSRERQKRQGAYRYYGAAGIIDYLDDFLFNGIYLLVGEDGSVVTTSGNPVVQYVWGKFWVNNHAHVLKAAGGVSDEHLLLLLQQVYVAPFVTGAVQQKLSQTNMKAIPIICGSPALNQTFRRFIDTLYAKIRMLHDEIGILISLRDALLPKLISGELRLKNDNSAKEAIYE